MRCCPRSYPPTTTCGFFYLNFFRLIRMCQVNFTHQVVFLGRVLIPYMHSLAEFRLLVVFDVLTRQLVQLSRIISRLLRDARVTPQLRLQNLLLIPLLVTLMLPILMWLNYQIKVF